MWKSERVSSTKIKLKASSTSSDNDNRHLVDITEDIGYEDLDELEVTTINVSNITDNLQESLDASQQKNAVIEAARAESNIHSTRDDANCPICRINVTYQDLALFCDRCKEWFHSNCLFITEPEYRCLAETSDEWYCDHCQSIRANNIKWGDLVGEDSIIEVINEAYREIIKWKKNLFPLPRGKCGSDLVKELARLVYLFVDKTKWEGVALSLVHIFLPIMLQKPSKTSKARDHAKYLTSRLEKWNKGDLKSLMEECCEIQRKLCKQMEMKRESNQKAFCRLMFAGKVGQAIKFVNNDDNIKGVHNLTDEVIKVLDSRTPPPSR